jgi:NNP family nitrate/nitrite transporter-like MFS transporter
VVATLPGGGAGGSFPAFLGAFVVLFLASGIGNGSVYRMIPVVFSSWHARRAGNAPEAAAFAQKRALQETGAVVGFVSAVAAYGAFLVPKAFGTSLRVTGGPEAAIWAFVAAYASCLALTWWFYARKGAELPA